MVTIVGAVFGCFLVGELFGVVLCMWWVWRGCGCVGVSCTFGDLRINDIKLILS